MTFSLVARCIDTGRHGMVIASSSPAVAARCAHARAGVGVVASQNITDPDLGPRVLDALQTGLRANAAVAIVLESYHYAAFRQLLVVDRHGESAIHSGRNILGIWGQSQDTNCAAAGNLLANDGVPAHMLDAFRTAKGDLGDRLVVALEAGLAAGGEAGPVHSAGLKVVDQLNWPYVDLRVDWSGKPVEELKQAWLVYKPQADAYVQRALNPAQAPSYGVPGDR
jgi:uncharacterized Ntn-hydrolase superfamily protein